MNLSKLLIYVSVFFILISCGSSGKYRTLINTVEDYPIIPKPANLEFAQGRFLVDEETRVYASKELQNEAIFLKNLLSTAVGKEIIYDENSAKAEEGIFLKITDGIKDEEGYELEISPEKIILTASSPKGIFYGVQTLRQLLPPKTEKTSVEELTIPAVVIKDKPRYRYRGMHLDVGRHMFPVNFIKSYIDMIAMHKMNTFHWHLTEDQGWRIEIKKYPKLTEIGSYRKETMVDKNYDPYIGDGKPYKGFYTQEEIKEIVAYAKKNHITVIPEIEMPGHSLAVLAAYPEFGNGTGPYEVATTWGVHEEILAPKEETFRFLEEVLVEVMALFPSKYIHIGGDEAPKIEWQESVQAQEVIEREGLKDENELQSYFIQRIEKFLNKNGRQIIGWDEILEGGLAPNATVMSWRGMEGGITASKAGHDVVMTPNSTLYFDKYQAGPEGEPFAIGGMITVEEVYAFEPTPIGLSDEEADNILGAQANVWTEHIKTPEHVQYMVLPRMTALAEVLWTPAKDKDWKDFKKRLSELFKRFESLGLNHAKHVFN